MKNSQVLEEIGHNIQWARMKKGLTQEQLAEKCNGFHLKNSPFYRIVSTKWVFDIHYSMLKNN